MLTDPGKVPLDCPRPPLHQVSRVQFGSRPAFLRPEFLEEAEDRSGHPYDEVPNKPSASFAHKPSSPQHSFGLQNSTLHKWKATCETGIHIMVAWHQTFPLWIRLQSRNLQLTQAFNIISFCPSLSGAGSWFHIAENDGSFSPARFFGFLLRRFQSGRRPRFLAPISSLDCR